MIKLNWPVAPRLLEEIVDFADALMVGGALITLLNNADRVKVACQAQLVNVIGAIFAEPGGAAWRQTIFHPFKIMTEHAHGSVLEAQVYCSRRATRTAGPIDDIVAAVVHDAAQRKIVFFILNRESSNSVEIALHLHGFPAVRRCHALELTAANLSATNSAEMPDTIVAKEHTEFLIREDRIVAALRPLSWNMLAVSC